MMLRRYFYDAAKKVRDMIANLVIEIARWMTGNSLWIRPHTQDPHVFLTRSPYFTEKCEYTLDPSDMKVDDDNPLVALNNIVYMISVKYAAALSRYPRFADMQCFFHFRSLKEFKDICYLMHRAGQILRDNDNIDPSQFGSCLLNRFKYDTLLDSAFCSGYYDLVRLLMPYCKSCLPRYTNYFGHNMLTMACMASDDVEEHDYKTVRFQGVNYSIPGDIKYLLYPLATERQKNQCRRIMGRTYMWALKKGVHPNQRRLEDHMPPAEQKQKIA